ncbi:lysophospholipase L1-like esterase [Kribbella rubisoli]|uniref:Lysophospholipase L1-like esterase n=1 Tax=Kribbella rubisoli TaxID=3075929 RepID=A0A4Q7WZK9_9ACTN|nr:SGNH/GDSL hydrolase family protein [Kribbella rubisoli]RZU15728.1 lysophospholipase L1-like esterase [Kribbella rubisoli]
MRFLRTLCALTGVLAALVTVAAHTSLVPATARQTTPAAPPAWSTAWMTALQQSNANQNWSKQGFANQSVRQVIRLSSGGSDVRIRISNQYGVRPLELTGATVAKAGKGAAVVPGSVQPVRFGGTDSVSIPAGGQVAGDAVTLPGLTSGSQLAITLYFARATGPATFHEFGATGASYRAAGDQLTATGGAAYRETSGGWYFLAGVDVTPSGAGLVVAFGDSITNGYTTAPGTRYPDLLAARIGSPVLNAGLGGNRLLADSACYGENGLARFQRDVLDEPGTTTALVLIGVNDLGYPAIPPTTCTTPNPPITPAQLISGYRALIRDAHARGIRIVGVTLTPFRGASVYTAHSAELRTAVNTWITTSGEFDAVADFASALADPADPARLAPKYDSGDHLHPNEAGYRVMADAVDLKTL